MDTTLDTHTLMNADDTDDDLEEESAPRPAARLKRYSGALGGCLLVLLGAAVGFGGARWRDMRESVLSVNNENLSKREFYHRLEQANGQPLATQMTLEMLQLQFAEKQGALPSDSQIEAKYAKVSAQPDFKANLAKTGQTPDDIKRALRLELAQFNLMTKGVTVDDAEIQKFYQQNADPKNPNARYYRPETVTLAVIVSDQPADLKAALSDLAHGVPFPDVARKYSKDTSKQNGGLLPPLRKGQVDAAKFPGMEQTFFKLKPGQQLDEVKLANTYWLVRCVERTPEAKIAFEQVKDECEEGALLTKGIPVNRAKMQEAYTQFEKESSIKAHWSQYEGIKTGK